MAEKNTAETLVAVEFVNESELATEVHESNWIHCDCGHDCCPCNAQCK